jgi:pyridoxal phosphate enzyme (YggS family)
MSEEIRNQLSQNLLFVRERIEAACLRAGRATDEVKLVAVTKYAETEWVNELVNLGVLNLGESRPQQLVRRARELRNDIHWHFIGHLQRNKAADIVPVAELIHSVDSLRLFDHLAELGRARKSLLRVLLEVNVSGEASKDGFSVPQLLEAWPKIREMESLDIAGLMTMAPLADNADLARPYFRKLRELRDRLRDESNGRWPLNELSMGMSGDFEAGIEEGATIIRVGSLLFEKLIPTSDNSAH